ncbi:MAG: hypothetical protein V3R41_04425 [Gammaproteobacteria bacterium]
MPKNTNEIMSLIKRVSGQESSLNMLMEFERTLDATNLYAYQNWMSGELVEGPVIDRYWFTTTWMYPHKLMPDPAGSLRLLKFGCKVYYRKDTLKEPTRVFSGEDLKSGQYGERKQAKIIKKLVWLVTIEMPRKFVDEAQEAMLEFEDGAIDVDDISAAYDEDLGDEEISKEQNDINAEDDAREAEFAGPGAAPAEEEQF